MRLETSRLTLVPSSPEALLALIDQPERFESITGIEVHDELRAFYVSGEVSPAWLASLRASSGPDPWRYGFFLGHRETRTIIGSAGFKGPPDADGTVEIAYGVVPSFQRQGFATEAAAALVAFALADTRVRTVLAHTLPEANPSTRVLEKCGFAFAGPVIDPEDGPVWRWQRPR